MCLDNCLCYGMEWQCFDCTGPPLGFPPGVICREIAELTLAPTHTDQVYTTDPAIGTTESVLSVADAVTPTEGEGMTTAAYV